MDKITPCLWFDRQAEEAAQFYTGIFKNSKILEVTRYGEAGYDIHGMPAGTVMTVEFELDGQSFTALNGGPAFNFNEAISFQISCKDQQEVDYYWEKLSEGGDESAQQCGWLKDKYGLSWQIVPTAMGEMMRSGSPEQIARITQAFLPMKKLDLATLQSVYAGSDRQVTIPAGHPA